MEVLYRKPDFSSNSMVFGSKKTSGLDIGNATLKSSVLGSFLKKVTLKSFAILPTDERALKSGEVLKPDMLASLVKQVGKGHPKNVVLGLSGSSIMVKKINIPSMAKELIPEQIRWEAEQYIPFNIDEVNIDYVLLNGGVKSESMELLLVVAQQSKLNQFTSVVQKAGLKPVVADVASFALANCFLFNYPELKSGTVGLIDAGAFFTHFVVMHQGEVIFCRDLPVGGQRFDEELSKNLGVPAEQARQMKEARGGMPDLALDTLSSVAVSFSEQILGSVEFFTETTPGVQIGQFFLTGGAALTPGLADQLAQTLNTPLEFLDVLKKIEVSGSALKKVNEQDLQYRSAVSLGLGLRKVGDR